MATDTTPDDVTETIDVTGESCPMPVVRTKQAVDDIAVGDVLEVLATDSGSVSDIDGWADSLETVELLAQTESTADGQTVYHHFVERVGE
ncbi:sulfurtransferase TusA family protein [Haloarcula onubensis]|uniref:Sulfurtransferase TusA family protein n=1 Tax=Haloarcula onubensis TaxID=2950539 RepID=A0ABU2FMZ9_9EURY|nr:sulfurtransferase TusA family protein [Halomicroarcula sp. S3CR25-11]MDS0281672.1 sulfurtransferase TusA family protein [Halomicroarcula sp. S3CR25-11]